MLLIKKKRRKKKVTKFLRRVRKKKALLGRSKKISLHLLHMYITKSNLKISVSKAKGGNVVFKKSEGCVREIKHGSINSAYASKQMVDDIVVNLKRLKIKKLGIYLKGATRWKKAALRRFFRKINKLNLSIIFIRDLTGIPHNGCPIEKKRRKKKRRRKKYKKYEWKIKLYRKIRYDNQSTRFKIIKKTRKRSRKVKRLINIYLKHAYPVYHFEVENDLPLTPFWDV